jgi:hypothetical protein
MFPARYFPAFHAAEPPELLEVGATCAAIYRRRTKLLGGFPCY